MVGSRQPGLTRLMFLDGIRLYTAVRCILQVDRMTVELTRLSEKGQIVIPTDIRKKMKLKEGEKFLVLSLGDTIVLRKLQLPEEKARLKGLLAQARRSAKKHGLSEREIERLIHSVRKMRE